MRNVKKVLAVFLAVLFVLPGVSVGLTASAEDAVMFTVVPNVTTAHPGDTITYTVYMDPVPYLDGLQLTLGLPDGLTFKQADTDTELLTQMLAACPEFSVRFSESSLTLLVFTMSTTEYFTSTENGVLLTFTCTVDDDASGEKTMDLSKHVITNRTIGGNFPTEYDPTDSVVTVTKKSVVKYDLWVGGTEVTEDCTSGEGWEYEPATNTLTLNDYQYEGEGHALPAGNWVYSADTSRGAIVYAGSDPLNLVLEGDNAVKQTGGDLRTSAGLFSEGALTISGTGTLTAEAGEATLDVESKRNYTFGIYSRGPLTVTGGTVTGRGGMGTQSHSTCGIYANGFELSFGEVYAYGGSVTGTGNSTGLYSTEAVTVSGGKLTCRGGQSTRHSDGLRTGRNMTVTGGTVDVASGEGSSSSYGIEGARRGDVLYIGASVDSFVSAGIGYAVDDYLTVKNEIPGKGWKTVDGTDDAAEIAVNTDPGAGLWQYKKVEFKQTKKYDLWVGETEVTSVNLSGEGWSFEPETNTLTLDGFTYSGVGHKFNEVDFKYLSDDGKTRVCHFERQNRSISGDESC